MVGVRRHRRREVCTTSTLPLASSPGIGIETEYTVGSKDGRAKAEVGSPYGVPVKLLVFLSVPSLSRGHLGR